MHLNKKTLFFVLFVVFVKGMASDLNIARYVILRLASYVAYDFEVIKRVEAQALEASAFRLNQLTPEQIQEFREMSRMNETELRLFVNNNINTVVQNMMESDLMFPQMEKKRMPVDSNFFTQPVTSGQNQAASDSRKRPRMQCKFCNNEATHTDNKTLISVCPNQQCIDQIS